MYVQGNLVSNILRMNTLASAAAFSGTAFSEEALASASAFALASAAAFASAPAFEMPPQVSHIKSRILQCCLYVCTYMKAVHTYKACMYMNRLYTSLNIYKGAC
jgi:hypothetical protein